MADQGPPGLPLQSHNHAAAAESSLHQSFLEHAAQCPHSRGPPGPGLPVRGGQDAEAPWARSHCGHQCLGRAAAGWGPDADVATALGHKPRVKQQVSLCPVPDPALEEPALGTSRLKICVSLCSRRSAVARVALSLAAQTGVPCPPT